jgi:hypothetical protein
MRAMTRVSLAGLAAMLTMAGCSGPREAVKPVTAGVRATQNAPSQPPPPQTTHAQATAALSLPDAAVHSPSRTASANAEPYLGTGGPETAEPVSYTDKAGDATGDLPPGAPNQQAFDILRVDWAPVSPGDYRRGYSTSMTVAGTPRGDGVYMTYGQFTNAGEVCQLYNILTPGATAYANAFCGNGETRRFIGRVQGGRVSSTPTAGGTSLMATFDDPALPTELESAGRRLYGLGAFTALCAPEQCTATHENMDYASSSERYRV